MKVKYILIFYLIGIIFITLGALSKILHYPILGLTGSILITIGTTIQTIAILLGIWKLLTTKKFKDFLNS